MSAAEPAKERLRQAIESLPLAKLGMIGFPVVSELEPYPAFGPRQA